MVPELNKRIEENAPAMVKSLQEIVKIRSVLGPEEEGAPYGVESRRAMQCAMDIAKDLGFEKIVNIEDRVCYVEYGEGEKVVGVFAHLDVVPEGENWQYPPYGGEIHDNKIYGRGTVDNKGPFIASLYALKAIKDLGLPVNCRIRVVGGTNEETGCQDMKYYLKHCGAPDTGFTPDGIYPMSFTERGINYYTLSRKFETAPSKLHVVSLKGGDILNMVPDKATLVLEAANAADISTVTAVIDANTNLNDCTLTYTVDGNQITVKSQGLCAHSCTPFNGRNAIVSLIMLLQELQLDGTVGAFVSFFMKKISNTTDGSLMGMKREDICGKLTFSLSKIEMDDTAVKMIINIRFPYTYKDDVTPDFQAQMGEFDMQFDDINVHPTYCYPMDHPLITTLRTVYEDLTGRDSTPCNEGGTYAKTIPNIVPFGSIFPDKIDYCHRPNENVDIDEYILDAKLFGNAMYSLAETFA